MAWFGDAALLLAGHESRGIHAGGGEKLGCAPALAPALAVTNRLAITCPINRVQAGLPLAFFGNRVELRN
jgi:hypothetical protein